MEKANKRSTGVRIKDWCRAWARQWQLQTMVLPGIIAMIIFNFIPIYGLSLAFRSYTVTSTMASAPWVGLENFKIIINDKYFWESVQNTIGISAIKLTMRV